MASTFVSILFFAATLGLSVQQNQRTIFVYVPGSGTPVTLECDAVVDVSITSFSAVPSPNTQPCDCTMTSQAGDSITQLRVNQFTDVWRVVRTINIDNNPQTFTSVVTPTQTVFEGVAYDLPISISTSKSPHEEKKIL